MPPVALSEKYAACPRVNGLGVTMKAVIVGPWTTETSATGLDPWSALVSTTFTCRPNAPVPLGVHVIAAASREVQPVGSPYQV